MITFVVLCFFGAALLGYFGKSLAAYEVFPIWFAYFLHAAFAVGQVIYTVEVFGYGDMLTYHHAGEYIAKQVRERPHLMGELIELALQRSPMSFRWVPASGTSTGTLNALSAFASLIVGGSIYTKCLLFSLISFIGKLGFYFGFKAHLPRAYHRRALVASLLVPSLVFWTAGILKESVAVAGLGLMFLLIANFIKSPKLDPWLIFLGAIGATMAAFSKAYVFFPLAIAGAVWFFAERSKQSNGMIQWKLRYVLLGAVLIVVALLGLGRLFPSYSVHNLAEETSQLQHAYTQIDAGSTIEMNEVRVDDGGFRGQLRNTPIAFVSSLFRPFIFEARNAAMFINSLETSALILLLLLVIVRRGVAGSITMTRKEPLLVFCAVYVFVFAVSVGLAAPNLGTLSRYRVPMLPAYWFLLLALLPLARRRKPQGQPPQLRRIPARV